MPGGASSVQKASASYVASVLFRERVVEIFFCLCANYARYVCETLTLMFILLFKRAGLLVGAAFWEPTPRLLYGSTMARRVAGAQMRCHN